MSQDYRPQRTYVTICDLCGGIITEGQPDERGSITWGYIAHKITSKTRWAWLRWPSPSFARRAPWSERSKPENRERHYDFHGQCIVDLVEKNLYAPEAVGGQSDA